MTAVETKAAQPTALRKSLAQPRIDALSVPSGSASRSRSRRSKVLQNSGVLTEILSFVGGGAMMEGQYRTCKLWLRAFNTEKAQWRHLRVDFETTAERTADALRHAHRLDCLEVLTVPSNSGVIEDDEFDGEEPHSRPLWHALNLFDVLVCLRPRRLRRVLVYGDWPCGPRYLSSVARLCKRLPAIERVDLSWHSFPEDLPTDMDARIRFDGCHAGECKPCGKPARMVTCDGCGLRGPHGNCTDFPLVNERDHGQGAVVWCGDCGTTLCAECFVKSFCPSWRQRHPRQAPVRGAGMCCRYQQQNFRAVIDMGGYSCSGCGEFTCEAHRARCWRPGCRRYFCTSLRCGGARLDPLPQWGAEQQRAFAACCGACRREALDPATADDFTRDLLDCRYDGRDPPSEVCPLDEFRAKFSFLTRA